MANDVYDLTESEVFKHRFGLRDQLERAALSISNNIAEGFERGTINELLSFLYIARGSAGEVRSMLCFLEFRTPFKNYKLQIADYKSKCEKISRQLYGWMESLKNSGMDGQRYENEKIRQQRENIKKKNEFLEKLKQISQEAVKKRNL